MAAKNTVHAALATQLLLLCAAAAAAIPVPAGAGAGAPPAGETTVGTPGLPFPFPFPFPFPGGLAPSAECLKAAQQAASCAVAPRADRSCCEALEGVVGGCFRGALLPVPPFYADLLKRACDTLPPAPGAPPGRRRG